MQRLPLTVKIIILLTGALIAGAGIWLYVVFYGPNNFTDAAEKTFFVSKGETVSSVIDSLEAHGIIRNRTWFVFVARFHSGTTKVQVGKYKFRSGISNYELFRSLSKGENVSLVTVTIPEGLIARQQARLLARTLGIDSSRYMALVFDKQFIKSLDVESNSLEGYLFPETYAFRWQVDESEIITRLVREFQSFYNDSLKQRTKELGWTVDQAVTLASIVEGEAVLANERPTISGVYHNRLRKGMRLEADPTVRYAMEAAPRRILYSDLRTDNPYNTYKYFGLPPGPICNPGKASILAALYPMTHPYLFFVADGRGGHWFSSTYAEHQRNVNRYRRERRLRALNESGGQAGKIEIR